MFLDNITTNKSPARNIEDFLYAFSIYFGMLVQDNKIAGLKTPNREHCLRAFSKRWIEEDNNDRYLDVVLDSIVGRKGTTISIRPGMMVSYPQFVYDSYFCLLIGRSYRHPTALDIPVKWINQLNEDFRKTQT